MLNPFRCRRRRKIDGAGRQTGLLLSISRTTDDLIVLKVKYAVRHCRYPLDRSKILPPTFHTMRAAATGRHGWWPGERPTV